VFRKKQSLKIFLVLLTLKCTKVYVQQYEIFRNTFKMFGIKRRWRMQERGSGSRPEALEKYKGEGMEKPQTKFVPGPQLT